MAALRVATLILLMATVGALCAWVDKVTRERDELSELLLRHVKLMTEENPHSFLLGKTIEVRCRKGSDEWEKVNVVAVSWKGGLCVRPVDGSKSRWIDKRNVREMVQ